uniref:Uncharacterized protein n=1 Tax=Rhizophora mucronata TaxID=61149 RepID=A0A2P2P923_RHIMU
MQISIIFINGVATLYTFIEIPPHQYHHSTKIWQAAPL